MIKKLSLLLTVFLFACHGNRTGTGQPIITVSIPPFRYFVERIAGHDFAVNVMVLPGSNPHVYEPVPSQIDRLSKSKAYISDGFLGFEQTWLDRFYEINRSMVKLSLGDFIEPIEAEHRDNSGHAEGADPHYWVSPRCVMKLVKPLGELLSDLNPAGRSRYEANCDSLMSEIIEADRLAQKLFSAHEGSSFMIYHPNLAYLARDYGLKEIAVEFEGKEPLPSKLKELIDLAKEKKIGTIFVQKEFDMKNAREIAGEIGAKLEVIDPLSPEWYKTTIEIITALNNSMSGGQN